MTNRMKSQRKTELTRHIISFTLMVLYSLVILIPFYIMLITALKTNQESMNPQFTWWPKNGLDFEGFKKVLFNDVSGGNKSGSTILNGFKNTMIVVLPRTAIWLFSSSLSAFAFAKMRFRLKKVLFSILLGTMMIPGVVLVLPSYMIWNNVGLVDTFIPIMLPGMFGGPVCVFFLRQFFFGIPDDLVEAGKIDGMGYFMIYARIIIPLSASALIAQTVLGFVGGYNEYFEPLLYLISPKNYTLQIALRNYISTTGVTDWQKIMSGAVVALVPSIVLYIIAQRFFIEGIATSGLKF